MGILGVQTMAHARVYRAGISFKEGADFWGVPDHFTRIAEWKWMRL